MRSHRCRRRKAETWWGLILAVAVKCGSHRVLSTAWRLAVAVNPSNAEATFIQSIRLKDFWKPSKPCHVGIHGIALAECSQMSTHLPGFQSIFRGFALFCIGQITSSVRFKCGSHCIVHSLAPVRLWDQVASKAPSVATLIGDPGTAQQQGQ